MQARPVINLDEPIGKVVGRRLPPVRPAQLQETINQVFSSQGHRLWKRGVFRFRNHADANLWKQMMIQPMKPT